MARFLIIALALLLGGCDYTVPLVTAPALPIGEAAFGLWQRARADGESEYLLVLPLGEREALVSWPAGTKNALFARAALWRGGGLTLVQLDWFGNAQGTVQDDERSFQYATYSIADGELNIRMVDTARVSKDIATTAALERAIVAAAEDPALFRAPLEFTRIAPQPEDG